jgi:hypothetical protein
MNTFPKAFAIRTLALSALAAAVSSANAGDFRVCI